MVGLFEGLNPSHPVSLNKLLLSYTHAISQDGRQAAVAELRRADKLKDVLNEGRDEFQRWV